MNCNCPSCTSGQTQRLSVIYEAGVMRANRRSMQTAASRRAAPPPPMTYAGPLVAIFFTCLVIGAVAISRLPPDSWLVRSEPGNALQAAFLFVPMILWVIRAYRYNGTTWRQLLDHWQRSFQCNRCGQVFKVSKSG